MCARALPVGDNGDHVVNRTRSNGGATIDMNPCVRCSGPARPSFEFLVTSVQNHRGSRPRSNNDTGVIFGMIHFSVGLLLSVGQFSTLTVKIKCTCNKGVSHSEVYTGSAGSDREFL